MQQNHNSQIQMHHKHPINVVWANCCGAIGFGRCGLLHANYVFKGLGKMKMGFKDSNQ
jgi:hypothetical protein